MRRRTHTLSTALLLLALLAPGACRSVEVSPDAPDWQPPATPVDATFSFACRTTVHAPVHPDAPAPRPDGSLSGERLAELTAEVREMFEATGAFRTLRRGPAGDGLHLELSALVDEYGPGDNFGFFFALSLGLFPAFEGVGVGLEARVTRPGREPAVYRARARSDTTLWTPFLPIWVGQALFQDNAWERTVASMMAQVAADDWLTPPGER